VIDWWDKLIPISSEISFLHVEKVSVESGGMCVVIHVVVVVVVQCTD